MKRIKVKGKSVHVFNQTPCLGNTWRSGGIAPCIIDLGATYIYEWFASRPGRSKHSRLTQWMGSWVGTTTGMDSAVRCGDENILCSCCEC